MWPPTERRLFLALWPEAAERQALAAVARRLAGRRAVRSANLHLTLVFLGATSAERLACYEAALEGFDAPRLELRLERIGYFRRPRILWLGPVATPPELLTLVADLGARLAVCGFTLEARPFRPHITLARHFPGPVPGRLLTEPLFWTADRVALVESHLRADGPHYQVVRRWPAGRG